MKLSKSSPTDKVIRTQKWKLLDNCPVCRLIKRAIREDREISQEEWQNAFAKAEMKTQSV